MFHSATLKLTLWYLLIIMAISLLFSIALYRVSTQALGRGFSRQAVVFNALPFQISGPITAIPGEKLEQIRIENIRESQQQLRTNLLYFNLLVLGIGGWTSYILAKRTLAPIEAAHEAQSRFTADASHELRTPLTAMQTEIEVALRDKNLSLTEAKALLQSNLEETQKLTAIVDGLLKLAHTQSEVTLRNGSIDLATIIDTITTRLAKRAEQRHITVSQTGRFATITGDPGRLEELFSILLENAIKYSPEEETVTIKGKTTSEKAHVTIHNTGTPIDPRDLPHIFDRFYRGDKSRTKSIDGYGLGLAIAKTIADAHRGTISVTSTETNGTTFTVTLPKN